MSDKPQFGAWSDGSDSATIPREEHLQILKDLEELYTRIGESGAICTIERLAKELQLSSGFNKRILAELAVYISALILQDGPRIQALMRKELAKITAEIKPKEITAEDIADLL